MQELNDMRGRLVLRLSDRDGRVIHEQRPHNRIVRTGRQLVAQLFGGVAGGTPPARVTHMAVGTNATPAADDQTALLGERVPRKPISDVSYVDFDETVDGKTTRRVRATLKAIFDFDDANDPAVPLREAAIFTDAAGGVMYNRVVFEPVTKTKAFKLTLLWDITF